MTAMQETEVHGRAAGFGWGQGGAGVHGVEEGAVCREWGLQCKYFTHLVKSK